MVYVCFRKDVVSSIVQQTLTHPTHVRARARARARARTHNPTLDENVLRYAGKGRAGVARARTHTYTHNPTLHCNISEHAGKGGAPHVTRFRRAAE